MYLTTLCPSGHGMNSGTGLPVWMDMHAWSLALKRYPFHGYWPENHPLFWQRQGFFCCYKCTLLSRFQGVDIGKRIYKPFLDKLKRSIRHTCFAIWSILFIKCTLFEDFMGVGQQKVPELMISQRWPAKSSPIFITNKVLATSEIYSPFPLVLGTSMGDQL